MYGPGDWMADSAATSSFGTLGGLILFAILIYLMGRDHSGGRR